MMAEIVMNNQRTRDFASLAKETQQLALAIGGQAISGTEVHLLNLAKNLRNSEVVVWATHRLIANEAIGINWEHLLKEIVDCCLKKFHQESYWHLMRMQNLMQKQLNLYAQKGSDQIDDFGFLAFRKLRHFKLTPEDQNNMIWAASFHDLCRMCYSPSFWNTPGPFTSQQRKQLDFHARNFFYLGEMVNAYPEVIALSVLHHWPNKGYPGNGVIAKLKPFLNNPKFRYMLNWLVTTDVYCGATDKRSYRQTVWGHLKVLKETLPRELSNIGMGFVPFIHAIWQPNQVVACPI